MIDVGECGKEKHVFFFRFLCLKLYGEMIDFNERFPALNFRTFSKTPPPTYYLFCVWHFKQILSFLFNWNLFSDLLLLHTKQYPKYLIVIYDKNTKSKEKMKDYLPKKNNKATLKQQYKKIIFNYYWLYKRLLVLERFQRDEWDGVGFEFKNFVELNLLSHSCLIFCGISLIETRIFTRSCPL